MSTIEPKPNKVRILNTKLLPIAAILLLVLALLFMTTPLLRGSGFSGRSGFNRPANGQFVPRTGTGTAVPGGQNGFSGQGNGSQGQGFSGQGNSTTNGRTFANRPSSSLLRLGFLNGITGTIVYAILLLVALAAALGMFFAKRWGQILGIVMGIIYVLLALFSFLPMILLGFARALNGLTLGLDILRLILALAVIVLAVIPAKKMTTPITADPPTAASV
jgi:hypothetical protein